MYPNPNRVKYAFAFDAGNNGNETFTVKGPKGKKGRLYDYGVEGVTEAFVANCTMEIGDGSDADEFGTALAMGALALDTPQSVRTLYDPIADKTAFDALMVDRNIPADTSVTMTITDDSTSGIGIFFMTVDWDN